MKRKSFKGFTLIEVIVVMAVLAVLMAAIMQMFKPIRETFIDSTAYENQRTVQSGMVKYITESIRFSTDLGFYTATPALGAATAVENFADEYVSHHGLTGSDADDAKDKIKKKAQVIIIDRATGYNWNADHTDGQGRILRRKLTGNAISVDKPSPTNVPCNDWRLALGTQYYGDKNDFTITLDVPTNPADGIGVTVASAATRISMGEIALSNSGSVICQNLVAKGGIAGNTNAGVKSSGLYDTSKYFSGGGAAPSSNATIYIVFLNYGDMD